MEFPFTLNQLRYFNEVARYESMRIAAEELHVSRSPPSRPRSPTWSAASMCSSSSGSATGV